jgi:cytochrome P450
VTVASSPQVREYSPHDISTRRFWSQLFAVRDNTFAQLRAGDGLSWHRPLPSLFDTVEPGFWAVTRRVDIAHVSQHPELFTSTQGVALDPMPAEIQKIATFFLAMDPPEHTVYRRLISSAFTPRNVRRIEEQIQKNAVAVVDDLVGAGDVDFVAACSGRLPMMTISEMLGVAPSERESVAKAAEKLFSMSDDEYSSLEERAQNTINEMMLLDARGLHRRHGNRAEDRRARPVGTGSAARSDGGGARRSGCQRAGGTRGDDPLLRACTVVRPNSA